MRPTNLQFRSPDEATAGFNYPQVTYEGKFLGFPVLQHSKSNKVIPTFPRESRFIWQNEKAKVNIGPGSYTNSLNSCTRRNSMAKYVLCIM